MPFVVIPGTYHVKGFEPDGDSIRFQPDDPADWDKIRTGRRAKVNAKGQAQLRMEAIDAPETHYSAGGSLGTVRQPRQLGDAARDRLLALAGITNVALAAEGTHVSAADDGTRGHVMCREVDRYGRPVAFAGEAPAGNRDAFVLEAATLRGSLNHKLAAEGAVYPTFYTGLFADLREEIAAAVRAARGTEAGLWAADRTGGVTVASLAAVTEESVILPKLFRRLAGYIADNGGAVDLGGFKRWLEAGNDRVFVLGRGQETGLDNLVAVEGQTLRLTEDPLDLVFVAA